jgi:hypothetical protein
MLLNSDIAIARRNPIKQILDRKRQRQATELK